MKEKVIQTKLEAPPAQKMVREVLTQTPALKEMASAEIQTAKLTKDSQI